MLGTTIRESSCIPAETWGMTAVITEQVVHKKQMKHTQCVGGTKTSTVSNRAYYQTDKICIYCRENNMIPFV